MKIAVLGATGQLGRDVSTAFVAAGDTVTQLGHDAVDVASAESVKNSLSQTRFDVVVNTAAFHHVEKCEDDPALAFAVNSLGARHVGQVTDSLGAKLVHISTDYVFDGKKQAPYTEQDPAAPLNVYGNSKLSGEFFVRCANPRHFVVRVSAIYGSHSCRAKGGLNFVELMLKLSREREELRVVDDEFVTPTPTTEIARQLVVLTRTSDYGLYHATAEGSCSWYEFARAILEASGTNVRLERARPGEFPAKVPRPKYSVLENTALKDRSLNVFGHWKRGLENYLANRSPASTLTHASISKT
jgi:dTDP-4-dehydrorhamnose reductase